MKDDKWDKIPYILKTLTREWSLVLLPNFEAGESGWFDTSFYSVTENSIKLGDISVNLYIDERIGWNGKPGEFTDKELDAIVDHIAFRNFPEL